MKESSRTTFAGVPSLIEVPWFRLEILMHHLGLQRLVEVSGARLDENPPRDSPRQQPAPSAAQNAVMLFMHKVFFPQL